jgi:hypothetical protein
MENRKFITFDEFLKGTATAKHEDFVAGGAAVSDPAEFEKMRRHILSLYEGISARHSFIERGGSYVDCIPIDQQPGVRAAGGYIAEPPPFTQPSKPSAWVQAIHAPLRPGLNDSFGNEQYCPTGTIPMRRVTLEEMSRFESLDHFFHRGRWAKGHPRDKQLKGRDASSGHRYAHAYSSVNNNGGYTVLNLWDPNSDPGVFSLSQCWYSAQNSAGQVQTTESGWQVYPGKYNTSAPSLFIYWTADGYQNTGNYNLDAPAFIQTDNTWVLGGAFPAWSTAGGAQVGDGIAYQQDTSGNWWLRINDFNNFITVGYYPASLWGGSQMAQFATGIDYGGEVAPNSGSAATGQMGSGGFASAGGGAAAFQEQIGYFDIGATTLTNAALTGNETDPNYYTINVSNNDPQFGTFFYFGGPGGA